MAIARFDISLRRETNIFSLINIFMFAATDGKLICAQLESIIFVPREYQIVHLDTHGWQHLALPASRSLIRKAFKQPIKS